MIIKTKNGYRVVSEKGKALSKDNPTKKQSKGRLREVEFFKRHKSNR